MPVFWILNKNLAVFIIQGGPLKAILGQVRHKVTG